MFEEVPRSRRGLAAYLGVSQLTARRIVLGPFVIGGGVVLAAVGGSVAVAATVFTASTIRASDVPPHPQPAPVVAVSSSSSHSGAHRPSQASSVAPASPSAVPVQPGTPGSVGGSSSASSPSLVRTESAPSRSGSPSASATSPAGSPTSSGSPTATPSPAGNATVYVSGWNAGTKQLVFEFAAVSKGTGPQHSDVYSIASPRQFTATLAADVHIISGGQLCPPAGSSCTVDQLIAGTTQGFYAVLAVDPGSAVHQVSELDNQRSTAPPAPPTSTPTPTPTNTGGFAPAPGPQPSVPPSSQPTA